MSFLLPSLRSCPLASRRTTTTAVTLCPSLVRLAPTFCCTLAERRRAPSTARFTTPPLLTPQNPSPAWPLTRISHRCPADVAHLDEMPDPQQRQPTSPEGTLRLRRTHPRLARSASPSWTPPTSPGSRSSMASSSSSSWASSASHRGGRGRRFVLNQHAPVLSPFVLPAGA